MSSPDDQYYVQMQQNKGWQQILASFARFLQPSAGQLVIDVGTGPGALVGILGHEFGARAIGIDPRITLARNAQYHYAETSIQFIAGGLPDLPLASATADMVVVTNVLYLLDEPQSALQEMVRVLKKDGTFAMLNPSVKMSEAAAKHLATARSLEGFAKQNFIDWGRIAEHNFRWSVDDIQTLFQNTGLRLDRYQERIGDGLVLYVRAHK